MHKVLIALGANLRSHAGDPRQTFDAVIGLLPGMGIHVELASKYYRSPAWPDPSQPPFLNAVILARTDLSPNELMQELHEAETAFGRTRSVRNAPRSLDLDIIDFDGRVEEGPPALPHPRMKERAFVLVPLADIAPDWRHPESGQPLATLISAVPRSDLDSVRTG